MRACVGSINPVKIRAVENGLAAVFGDQQWIVEGVSVASGVSEQPQTETETIVGARNRARNLLEISDADYLVGIEGGLAQAAGSWMECGWVCVLDREGKEGIAASAKIMIPDSIHRYLGSERTLNDACAKFFGVENAGETLGYFGLMTNRAVDRLGAYTDAVSFALARFAHPHLFA